MSKSKDIRCTISGNLVQNDSLLGKLMENSGVNEPVLQGRNRRQNWSEVDGLYTSLAEGIVEIGSRIHESVLVIQAANFEETPELTSTIKGISRDLEAFSKDLITIHKRHDGKTGEIVSEDDYMLSLSVYTDYSSLNERLNAVLFPTMITIMDFTAAAVEKTEKDKAAGTVIEGTTEEVIKIGEGEVIE